MVVYDYKFPTLATKLYYHYRKNQAAGNTPANCKFNIINFVNVEYSRRVNPIQQKYISNLAAAMETAETLVESLQKGQKGGGGSDDFFQKSATNFLAACIYFFVNYNKVPYDKDGNILDAQYEQVEGTFHQRLTGRSMQKDVWDKQTNLWSQPIGKGNTPTCLMSYPSSTTTTRKSLRC